MEIKQLEIFVKLVELKSFSNTAKELDISQPTVSNTIKQLECELDCELLTRTTRAFVVTQKGRSLYRQSKRLLSIKDDILKEFSEKKSIINIGVSSIPGDYIFPKFLKKYREKNQITEIKIYESNSRDIVDKVKKNELDLGFVGISEIIDNVKFFPIYSDKLTFIARNNDYYRELFAQKPSVERLIQEPLILREKGSGTSRNFWQMIDKLEDDNPQINLKTTANSLSLIKKLVEDGIGCSFVSKISMNSDKHDLIEYDICEPDTSRNFYLIYDNDFINEFSRDFVEFVKYENEREQ
ncbi:MAG: selenium metabolism-associated LysR family transcriptional regulator [Tissierellia bacterium]|nr:selenium metabolism-associated LysR family transcriptional regulator [Tissierellia bacterium]